MARFSYCSMAYCRIFWGDCFCNSASKSTVASSSVAMSGSRLHQNQEQKNTRAAGGFLITNAYEVISRSEEHTSELQSRGHLVCRLLLEKNKQIDDCPLCS